MEAARAFSPQRERKLFSTVELTESRRESTEDSPVFFCEQNGFSFRVVFDLPKGTYTIELLTDRPEYVSSDLKAVRSQVEEQAQIELASRAANYGETHFSV